MGDSFWNQKKVLVAGGAGMIGSYLAELLVNDGAQVRVADHLQQGSLANLEDCRARIEFIQTDLLKPDACREAVQGTEAVFNLAAKTVGIGYSQQHHGEMFYETALLSMNLLEAARVAGVRRFLVVSSSCVYPDGVPVPTPEFQDDSGSPEKANEGYGWAKRFAELQGRYYTREYSMEIAIVRPANVYAPRYNWKQKEAHVIPALIRRILNGEDPLVVWGSGRQTRSFIHARDAALAMKLVTERAATGEPINLSGQETSVVELVSELTALADYRGKVIFDHTKPEGPSRKALLSEKFSRLIPEYRPQVTLHEGLKETVAAARAFFAGERKTNP